LNEATVSVLRAGVPAPVNDRQKSGLLLPG